MKKKITELIQIIIYILMGIQIVLGIAWIVCNLGKVPGFEESNELLSMSETLCVDEYTGFLYPLCIRGFTVLAGWIRLPMCSILYLIQLVFAYFTYEYFLRKVVFRKRANRWQYRKKLPFYVTYLMTIPMVLQVHMAILPYSFASSLYLVLMAKIIEVCEADYRISKKDISSIAIMWILSSQICVDYAWLAGIAVVIGMIRYMVLHRNLVLRLAVMMIASVVCISVLNVALQTPGSMGKIQRSPEAVMLNRVVWPNFNKLSFFWREEIRQNWTVADLAVLSTYPEKVVYEFGPAVDAMFGYKEADKIYRDMVKQTIKLDTKNVVIRIIKDGVAYICPPLTTYAHLQGVGSSYTGWNYGRMKDYAPKLTNYYVEYSLSAWIYILIACVLLGILGWRKEWMPEKEKKMGRWITGYCLTMSVLINLWYVMVSGNMQDYKKVVVISVLWAVLIVCVLKWSEEKTN